MQESRRGSTGFPSWNAKIDESVAKESGLDINAERIKIIVPVKLVLRHLRILFL